METLKDLVAGMPTVLPDLRPLNPDVPHAPVRKVPLNKYETEVALTNALRYFPTEFHAVLAPEFMDELTRYGHIYMYRFKPLIDMKAYPIDSYPAKCKQCAAVMHCLMNNLDPKVAQFPEELVTYGGNGQVLSNWIQFRLLMHYLATMNDHQTLVMMSGHPLGLFPSTKDSPRVVITNGMMIPNYSSKELYDKFFAMNVTMYGQMTAGSYCYIGPQGIVHGTTITVMNAGRKYLNLENLTGKVFVTSGLGGMSGAQPKAAVIAGCICVVAEVSPAALNKRLVQGWLMEATTSLDTCIDKIREARKARKPLSIGYLGNVVDLWQRLAFEYSSTGELLVDLGSDQTSLHNPYNGGYYPYQVSYEKANELMVSNPEDFRILVRDSLIRQIGAIDVLAQGGMHFWDYGNGFLLECQRAGAHMYERGFTSGAKFRYPSYVQDIMGDIFSLGFGPFRWICTSGQREDLKKSDEIACQVLKLIKQTQVSEKVKVQYDDNIHWIEHAEEHKLVVGSQSRILYSDQEGRVGIAVAFNDAIRNKLISGPIVISRDHHDVSGTDSPFRETSNIEDGSAFTADMAVQNFVGDSFRGATWVALHNGGGVGWGEVINGGFGLVLDGSEDAERRAKLMLSWDVANGVARRCWSGNENAREAIEKSMESNEDLRVTLPYPIEDPMMLVKLVSPNATPKSPRVHQKGKGNA